MAVFPFKTRNIYYYLSSTTTYTTAWTYKAHFQNRWM